ncbi:MAG: mechanosensitive ion channel [Elusimicrobia bacterium]|nr:mechanosensitive ion channel [Elusimicrobiota bacterium]
MSPAVASGQPTVNLCGLHVSAWIVGPTFLVVWILLGYTLKKVLFAWLQHLTSKTETKIDDIIIGALNAPAGLIILVWGISALSHVVFPSAVGKWPHVIDTASKVATIFAVVLFIDLLIINLIRNYSHQVELLKMSEGFATIVVHGVVFGLGILMLLDSVGVSITPIIASLGIGSLAVALALQPTLENFFSGIQILVDQPIRPGHFIRLDTGEEGIVDRVGWRTTWIRQLPNNMVIIPNKQVVNARVVNFNYPSPDLAIVVDVGVHYNSDLEKVERVTTEVAAEIMKRVPGGVPSFQPLIRYGKLNSSSIDFAVVMRAQQFVDAGLIKHEFIKSLMARYARENIVVPYPITAVNTSQESAIFRPS